MSKIILLNGASSSGKTSLARAIQHKSAEPWLRLGVDTFVDMMPDPYLPFGAKANEGFRFIPGENAQGPTMAIETGTWGRQVFDGLPLVAGLLADQGNNVIIDEVLLSEETLQGYLKALAAHTVYFVGVFCDLPTLQEREILRRDRAIGLSNDQANRVHPQGRTYDIMVDTTTQSPFALAKIILDLVHTPFT